MNSNAQTYRAILVLLAGVFLLDLMGAFVRILLDRYNASELSLYRNLIGILPAILLLYFSGDRGLKGKIYLIRQWPLAFVRGAMGAVAQLFFYLALGRMEFATVATILFSMALFSVAFSVPLLGEKVGPVRWLAVLIGFAGIVLVVRPGTDAFTGAAIFPIIAAALYALSGITSRMIDFSVPSPLIYMYSALAATVGAGILTLTTTSGFSAIGSLADLGLIVAMGLIGGSGVICLLLSYRMAQPSVLAPFNYFGIISAFFLGWIFFNETPFDTLFPGVILILGSGLLVIWRERQNARES